MSTENQPNSPRPAFKPNASDDINKVLRSSKPVVDGARPAILRFTVYRNQPRIVVWTNNPNDQKERVTCTMSFPDAYALLEAMEQIFRKGEETLIQMECLNYDYDEETGERSEKATKQATVVVGIDGDGYEYIGVVKANGDTPVPIKFYFRPNNYQRLVDKSGQELDKFKVSKLYAIGYVTMWRQLLAAVDAATYEKIEHANKFQSNPDGGGYQKKQWNNNQGGGYQKKQWNNNNGGYQKKQWNNNGGGNGGYQKKPWNNNNNGGGGGNNNYQAPKQDNNIDQDIPW